MGYVYNLNIIYEILNKIKFNLLCIENCQIYQWIDKEVMYDKIHQQCKCDDKKPYKDENKIIKEIVNTFLNEKIFIESYYEECGYHKSSKNLLEILNLTIHDIEECTCWNKNYGYLLQLDKLECILKNLRNILCQLKCLYVDDCNLISSTLCILFKIINLIESILSKINNMECLCESGLCCKCDIMECLVCDLEEEIDCFGKIVAQLADITCKIASREILNCTICKTEDCSDYKTKHDLEKRINEKSCDKEIHDKKY